MLNNDEKIKCKRFKMQDPDIASLSECARTRS